MRRADFERERDRAERLVAEVLRTTADTMAAKEATAWLEGELTAVRSRPDRLQTEIAQLEATVTGHQADFERERDRAERPTAEVLKATADAAAAKQATARLEGEAAALQWRTWWRRIAG
jgi:chromosome segregation ATPase